MINDAKPTSTEISQYKYVDDITLFFPFDKLDQTTVMQSELDNLKQWSDNNLMRLKTLFSATCCQTSVSHRQLTDQPDHLP